MGTQLHLEDVWAAYRARIKAFLHARVSDPEDVEDLLQDISIKVFDGLPGLNDNTRLQPWLFQTANRTIIDHYRKKSRRGAVHPDDLWYGDNETDARRDLERCVEPFIRALPPDTARMLTAIDLEGMSQKDYAKAEGVSYSTLKSRVQSGRAALKDLFDGCCRMTRDARGNIAEATPRSGACEKC